VKIYAAAAGVEALQDKGKRRSKTG